MAPGTASGAWVSPSAAGASSMGVPSQPMLAAIGKARTGGSSQIRLALARRAQDDAVGPGIRGVATGGREQRGRASREGSGAQLDMPGAGPAAFRRIEGELDRVDTGLQPIGGGMSNCMNEVSAFEGSNRPRRSAPVRASMSRHKAASSLPGRWRRPGSRTPRAVAVGSLRPPPWCGRAVPGRAELTPITPCSGWTIPPTTAYGLVGTSSGQLTGSCGLTDGMARSARPPSDRRAGR